MSEYWDELGNKAEEEAIYDLPEGRTIFTILVNKPITRTVFKANDGSESVKYRFACQIDGRIRTLSLSAKHFSKINTARLNNISVFEVLRIGTSQQTRYAIKPIEEPNEKVVKKKC